MVQELVSLITLDWTWHSISHLGSQAMQQSAITEPLARFLEFLFYSEYSLHAFCRTSFRIRSLAPMKHKLLSCGDYLNKKSVLSMASVADSEQQGNQRLQGRLHPSLCTHPGTIMLTCLLVALLWQSLAEMVVDRNLPLVVPKSKEEVCERKAAGVGHTYPIMDKCITPGMLSLNPGRWASSTCRCCA
jgi:hypothetical protein